MSQRFVTDEPLRVKAELLGQPLAAPWRRFAAFAVDYLTLVVPSVLLAVAAAATAMWVRDPAALRALTALMRDQSAPPEQRLTTMRNLTEFLALHHAAGLPRELEDAILKGQTDTVTDILSRADMMITFSLSDRHESQASSVPAGPGVEPTPVIHVYLERLIPGTLRAVVLYGLGALYFAVCTARFGGATLGKKLLGIRVVRLDGHHLSFAESLERFAGYLHVPGSLFLNLLDLWRDPNRRLPHDRVVHTAVVRVARSENRPAKDSQAVTTKTQEGPCTESERPDVDREV